VADEALLRLKRSDDDGQAASSIADIDIVTMVQLGLPKL
jgi:hypothetical protein